MQRSDDILTTGHLLSRSTCGIADWLGMALVSALAFGLAIILILLGIALARYAFAGRHGRPSHGTGRSDATGSAPRR